MTAAEQIIVRAELAGAEAKAAELRRALGQPAANAPTPPKIRKPRVHRPSRVKPPTASELPSPDVRSALEAKVNQMARAKGHV